MSELKLLIVEDDPFCQQIYTDYLQNVRCHISFCISASLAASLNELLNPTAVIIDLGLPDSDGVDALAQITAQSEGKTKPYLLVVTGSEDPERHQAALDAGADAVMMKPLAKPEFDALLALLITRIRGN